MRGLDDTDREILDLLLADARRPYSDIADQVGLSAPAVSDRVDRLREMGIVRGFTLDVDRSLLRTGVPVLLDIDAAPGRGEAIAAGLADTDAVEHTFRTADDRVLVTATVRGTEVGALLERAIENVSDVADYEVRLLADSEWRPDLAGPEFAPDCAECGNTVDEEGVEESLDGDSYYFCCESCADRFVEQYESLKDGI
ncbi:AsnC family transcriptional regulator [Halomicroarcula sp. GCM10025709]|uniref:AsnC family transcriptional regulator n=1 Tax=Haloarcula TaxID=2237 RepID=UPI0024C2B802|nr:AsnC family transcriptional regulator [Halomicroarcula sp. YJ-61-S]